MLKICCIKFRRPQITEQPLVRVWVITTNMVAIHAHNRTHILTMSRVCRCVGAFRLTPLSGAFYCSRQTAAKTHGTLLPRTDGGPQLDDALEHYQKNTRWQKVVCASSTILFVASHSGRRKKRGGVGGLGYVGRRDGADITESYWWNIMNLLPHRKDFALALDRVSNGVFLSNSRWSGGWWTFLLLIDWWGFAPNDADRNRCMCVCVRMYAYVRWFCSLVLISNIRRSCCSGFQTGSPWNAVYVCLVRVVFVATDDGNQLQQQQKTTCQVEMASIKSARNYARTQRALRQLHTYDFCSRRRFWFLMFSARNMYRMIFFFARVAIPLLSLRSRTHIRSKFNRMPTVYDSVS